MYLRGNSIGTDGRWTTTTTTTTTTHFKSFHMLEDDYFDRPSVKPHYLRESMALEVKRTLYPTLLSMWITAMQSIRELCAE
jgi:hypothetical protein